MFVLFFHAFDVYWLYGLWMPVSDETDIVCSTFPYFVQRFYVCSLPKFAFSALMLLVGRRKGIRPVKNRVVRCWRGYLSGARCRLAYAQLMPLPLTVSCFSKIQSGFTFLVLAHPGSPGKRAVKRVFVCVLRNCNIMSVWSLRRHFTNKSVTGAPYSIKRYSLSHSWTLW